MLFGSLFMAMPLAIIGNEYENAWVELKGTSRGMEVGDAAITKITCTVTVPFFS